MLHKEYIAKQLKDKKFKKAYDIESEIARLSVEIQQARIKLRLSQADLARQAKLTQQQVSAIEKGSNVTLKTLLQIGKVLGLKIEFQ
ncbi:MAG TPA: helix-turn-helix transcriptional regulator [Spirochaetota bacterium]|nr:helix-turn-helix transcriptional regulator [Spirochaetota bacterium]